MEWNPDLSGARADTRFHMEPQAFPARRDADKYTRSVIAHLRVYSILGPRVAARRRPSRRSVGRLPSVPSALNLRVGVPLLLSSVCLELDIRTAREHWQASLLMARQPAGGTHSGSTKPAGSSAVSDKVVRLLAPLLTEEGPGEVPYGLKNPPQSPLEQGGRKRQHLFGNSTKSPCTISGHTFIGPTPLSCAVSGERCCLAGEGISRHPSSVPPLSIARGFA